MSYRHLPPGKLTFRQAAERLSKSRNTLAKWLANPEDVPFQVPVRVCFMRTGSSWWCDEADLEFWLATSGNEAAWQTRCAERYAALAGTTDLDPPEAVQGASGIIVRVTQ